MWRWLALLLVGGCREPDPKAPDGPDSIDLGDSVVLFDHIDPRIASGGIGCTVGCGYPGATVPFGLAKPSPDTRTASGAAISANHGGGYHSDDTPIQGFS